MYVNLSFIRILKLVGMTGIAPALLSETVFETVAAAVTPHAHKCALSLIVGTHTKLEMVATAGVAPARPKAVDFKSTESAVPPRGHEK